MKDDLPEYVFVLYSNNAARTVEAIFDTVIELSEYLDVKPASIYKEISRLNTGKIKDSRIRKVRIMEVM